MPDPDGVIELVGAFLDGSRTCIEFASSGNKDDGTYDSSTTFEIVFDTGSFDVNIHTSCSQPLPVDLAVGLDVGDGSFMISNEESCGACLVPPVISIEPASWGRVKGAYRK